MALVLIGKPNVGKSSIFNRMVGRRRSLVIDQPGVTLDRLVDTWEHNGKSIEIWDLAGIQNDEPLREDWHQQVDGVLFVLDASEPLSSDDKDAFQMARSWNKPIIVLLNKSDKKSFDDHRWEAMELAAERHFELSAEKKEGFLELTEYCFERFQKDVVQEASLGKAPRVLIFGRPNVGKSSLLNRLAGTHVSITSDKPGTTRDLVEFSLRHGGNQLTLVDTAGIRKKARIYNRSDNVEIFSTKKAMVELKRSDACVVLVEASGGATIPTQDRKLLRLLHHSQKPAMLLVNKWDQVRESRRREDTFKRSIQRELKEDGHLPILLISAKTGYGVKKIGPALVDLLERQRKISTGKLNRWLASIMEKRTPRIAKAGSKEGKRKTQTQYLNFLYMTQIQTRPMKFQIFCNAPNQVPDDEKRYLENRLREAFKLEGLPIRLVFRKKTKTERVGR